MRQELALMAATNFVLKPGPSEVEYPFGTSNALSTEPGSKRRLEEPNQNPKCKKQKFTPVNDPKKMKYNEFNLDDKKILSNNDILNNLPPKMRSSQWKNTLKTLISHSVSIQSWNRYKTAMRKLNKFKKQTKTKISWPSN